MISTEVSSLAAHNTCDRCGKVVSAIRDEDMDDEREDEFGKRVAIKVSLPGTVVAAIVDTTCWSIWLDWKTFFGRQWDRF
jgi:hypothetical protein